MSNAASPHPNPAAGKPPCYNSGVSDDPYVLLYTRPGCHLCENASADLAPLARRHGLDVRTINIEDDAEAYDRWWDRIPVIVVGETVLKAPIDRVALRRAIERARA